MFTERLVRKKRGGGIMIWTRVVTVRVGKPEQIRDCLEVELTFGSYVGWRVKRAWAALRDRINYGIGMRAQMPITVPAQSQPLLKGQI